MGMGQDWLADQAFEWHHPFGLPGPYWVDKHGTPHKVTEMPTFYIRNCMSVVGPDDDWYEYFDKELRRRYPCGLDLTFLK